MLKQEAVIMLMYRGQNLDDDEYLITQGCRPGMRNDIKAEIYFHQSNAENVVKFKLDAFYDIVDENSNDYYLAELPEAAHEEPTSNENLKENRDSCVMELGDPIAIKEESLEAHEDNLEVEKNQIFAASCEPLKESRKTKLRSSPLNFWSKTLMFLLIILIFGVGNEVKSLVAYDCSKTEVGKIYSLMDTMECSDAYPMHIRSEAHKHYYLYQESNFRLAQVKECIVKKVTFVFHCGRWSDSKTVGD